MFKNIYIYNVQPGWPMLLEAAETALQSAKFTPCAASQEKSIGWIPPRGEEHGALIEASSGNWLMKLMVETKVLPSSVVTEKADEEIKNIEVATGRKPGKKEKRELLEDARMALLPMAFSKKSATLVWFDRNQNKLIVGAGSQSRSDEVVTQLVKALDGLALQPVNTKSSPAGSMAAWLHTQELPSNFSADRDCVLKSCDEMKSTVRYAKHALDIVEVRNHIQQGKVPTQLAMTWNDRVSFVLSEAGTIKKIAFLDSVLEEGAADKADKSGFDADFAITTGELSRMIPDLYEAMGGEVEIGEMA